MPSSGILCLQSLISQSLQHALLLYFLTKWGGFFFSCSAIVFLSALTRWNVSFAVCTMASEVISPKRFISILTFATVCLWWQIDFKDVLYESRGHSSKIHVSFVIFLIPMPCAFISVLLFCLALNPCTSACGLLSMRVQSTKTMVLCFIKVFCVLPNTEN